jgi:hypothetical protein
VKSKEVKIISNLAESSKEGYYSKRVTLLLLLLLVTITTTTIIKNNTQRLKYLWECMISRW